jgi:hypothetical protein
MWETVTVDDLARMLPRASRDDLARVLELCHSAEGHALLTRIRDGCGCVAGGLYCSCGQGSTETAAVADDLGRLWAAGR